MEKPKDTPFLKNVTPFMEKSVCLDPELSLPMTLSCPESARLFSFHSNKRKRIYEGPFSKTYN